MTNNDKEITTKTLAETSNYIAWLSEEPDETAYHLELNNITLHFFEEEWGEFKKLIRELV